MLLISGPETEPSPNTLGTLADGKHISISDGLSNPMNYHSDRYRRARSLEFRNKSFDSYDVEKKESERPTEMETRENFTPGTNSYNSSSGNTNVAFREI